MSGSLLTMDARSRLVVKVTAGAEAPERCAQAFTVAATAAASGVDVSLWLTGDATWFAVPGRAADFVLEHSAALDELLQTVLEFGQVTACVQCLQRRNLAPDALIDGVRVAGAASFVEEIMQPETQALVY